MIWAIVNGIYWYLIEFNCSRHAVHASEDVLHHVCLALPQKIGAAIPYFGCIDFSYRAAAECPPSIIMDDPVAKLAWQLLRNTHASAISSG